MRDRWWRVGAVLAVVAGCGSSPTSAVDGGGDGGGGGGGHDGGGGACVDATLLWSEDWETGDYRRWTSMTYDAGWGDACDDNALTTERAHGGTRAHRSEITCAIDESHRGYGGLQFDGDAVVPAYTNTGAGIDAPGGLVNTFHVWLESPTAFVDGTWFSFWTVNGSCDWSERVLTLGLEDASDRLAAAHYQPDGGTRTFEPGAPGFPRGQWVRITIYLNYPDGVMHVWQDGVSVSHVTFARASSRVCQWHWGAYASGDNDDVVLFEDDNSIWKLASPWTDFAVEPWLGGAVAACP
ncbi:MAG: hypothetical protein R2939_07935 [Kofleriaceae bacterium]